MIDKKEIGKRVLELRKSLSLSQELFGQKIGITKSGLSQIENGQTAPSLDLLNYIVQEFNTSWEELINGKLIGKPNGKLNGNLNEKMAENQSQIQIQKDAEVKKGFIPLIPIEAMAGFGSGDFSVLHHELTYYNVPEFNEAEFLIRVKGSSMYPKYNSGDILACKMLTNPNFLQWNKVYVLDTNQGALVKRLHPSPAEDYIELRSDNKDYPPFTIPKNDIRSTAIVIGVIRLE